MSATEIITICASAFALVVSIIAIALQYGHRDNTQFKVTKIELVSHEPQQKIDRCFAVVLSILIFNMGNRPVALDALSLTLEGEINASSDDDKVTPSSRSGQIMVPPMSAEAYNKFEFRPFVVQPSAINTKEVVFDLMRYEKKHKYITAEGNLTLRGVFYNAEGNRSEIEVPVAEIDIQAIKDEAPVYNIKFDTKEVDLHKVEF